MKKGMEKAEEELLCKGVTKSHVGQQRRNEDRKNGGDNSTIVKDGSNATKGLCYGQLKKYGSLTTTVRSNKCSPVGRGSLILLKINQLSKGEGISRGTISQSYFVALMPTENKSNQNVASQITGSIEATYSISTTQYSRGSALCYGLINDSDVHKGNYQFLGLIEKDVVGKV